MVPNKQVAVSKGTKLATGTVGVTPGIGLAMFGRTAFGAVNYPLGTPPLWPAFTMRSSKRQSSQHNI